MNRALLAAFAALVSLAANSGGRTLIGWAAGPAVSAELQAERTMMAVPTAANAMEIERHLSSVPHRAGSAADYATALYVQRRLARDGFATRIEKYRVEFTGPLEESLTMLAPHRVNFSMIEGVPGHPTRWERIAGPPFLEQSGDGTVTGPVVYVNTASKDDIAEIDAQHVNLKGAVAIVRLAPPNSAGIRGIDPTWIAYNELTKRGVSAILEFMDPATTGYGGGAMWPNGNYKNPNMAERMSGLSPSGFMQSPPGDPTSPGIAPLPGVPHKAWSEVPHASIPELSLTQSAARTLLAGLTGKVVPESWHPMYEFVQRFGGNEIVRVHTKFERKLKTIWLVFGDMRGSQRPDSIVMIGSHRDAMTFGAIDPGSGTTVLLQDADAFHALAQQGWRPKRTIEIASWDGHELGLFGSAAYIYQYGPQLRRSLFQYINTDQLTTGDPFVVSASPGLFAFMKQICDVVPSRDGRTMLGARDQRVRPLLNPIVGGSDHQNFAYMLGVLSTTNGYYGPFGAHHTAEDNLDGLRTYDPGMKEAVIAAQVTGIQAMRAANATVEPLRIEELPAQMLKDLNGLESAALERNQPVAPYEEIRSALQAYQSRAHQTDLAMERAEAAGDPAAMERIADTEQASRDAFYIESGLLQNPYYHTLDRVFTSLPEIAFAGNNAATLETGTQRALAAIAAATSALAP